MPLCVSISWKRQKWPDSGNGNDSDIPSGLLLPMIYCISSRWSFLLFIFHFAYYSSVRCAVQFVPHRQNGCELGGLSSFTVCVCGDAGPVSILLFCQRTERTGTVKWNAAPPYLCRCRCRRRRRRWRIRRLRSRQLHRRCLSCWLSSTRLEMLDDLTYSYDQCSFFKSVKRLRSIYIIKLKLRKRSIPFDVLVFWVATEFTYKRF